MALKLFVIDDVTGNCDLREMVPYTSVTSADGSVVITPSVGPNGQPIYDLAASVDVNVNNFSYNPATKEITLTETDGDTYTIDVSDLVDVETVTTLVSDGVGGFNYTSEDGTVTNIPAAVETVTTFVDNGDGTYTYTSEDGTVTTTAVQSLSAVTQVATGNEIATHDDGTGNVVSIQETVTTLIDNGNGSFTHTSEDGTVTTISACDLLSNAADTGQFIGG